MKSAEQVTKRWADLNEARATWQITWELISQYVMPNRRGFTRKLTKGDTLKDYEVADGTAVEANQKLSSSLHGALTAPSARWFNIGFRDKTLNDVDDAREWIQGCTDRMFKAFGDSNFNQAINESYLDLTGLGTGNVFVTERTGKDGEWLGLSFTTFHLSEVAIADNQHGQVDTIYRKYQLSARNALAKWPKAALGKVREVAEDSPDRMFTFVDVIEPNEDYNPDAALDAKARPYYHCVYSESDKEVLEEDGYWSLPHMVFRWMKQTGDDYGVGPSHFCMPEILGLNHAKQLEFDAWDKAIDPPMIALAGTVVGDIDLVGGGLTMVNDVNGIRPMYEQTNWNTSQFKSEEARAQIQAAFYNHLLDFPGGPNVTATEIVQRVELMQREMAPMLGRIQAELLNPLIERVFDLMFRAGQFEPPPESVMAEGDGEVDIEYISPLARAQRSGDIEAINRWVGTITQLAQVQPELLDWVDTDSIPGLLAERMGTPAEAVRSAEEVEQIRKQRAEMQQQMMAQQQMGPPPQ